MITSGDKKWNILKAYFWNGIFWNILNGMENESYRTEIPSNLLIIISERRGRSSTCAEF